MSLFGSFCRKSCRPASRLDRRRSPATGILPALEQSSKFGHVGRSTFQQTTGRKTNATTSGTDLDPTHREAMSEDVRSSSA